MTKCNLFSSWYSWEIAHLALNNNHSLTHSVLLSFYNIDKQYFLTSYLSIHIPLTKMLLTFFFRDREILQWREIYKMYIPVYKHINMLIFILNLFMANFQCSYINMQSIWFSLCRTTKRYTVSYRSFTFNKTSIYLHLLY